MKKYLLIILAHTSLGLFSQTTNDSLWSIWLNQSNPDTLRLIALDEFIYNEVVFDEPDSALILIERGLKLCTRKETLPQEAAMYNSKGIAYHLLGKSQEAIIELKKANELYFKGNKKEGFLNTTNNLAIIYNTNGDFNGAVNIYLKNVERVKKLNDTIFLADMLKNVGNLYYRNSMFIKAREYFNKSLNLYIDLNNEEGIYSCYINIGALYSSEGDYMKALHYNTKALKQFLSTKTNILGIANGFNNIGLVYMDMGAYNKASKFYLYSVKASKTTKDYEGVASALSNLGITFLYMENYQQAKKYFNEALKYFELNNTNEFNIIINTLNLGLVYEKEGDLDEALANYKQALNKAKKINALDELGTAFNNVGNVYLLKNELDSANIYLLQALKYREEVGNNVYVANTKNNLGELYLKRKDYIKSIEYSTAAYEEVSKQNDMLEIKNATHILWLAYKNTGQYENALKMHEEYLIAKDSIASKENIEEITRQTVKYENEKEQIRKENEAKEKARVEAEQLKRRNNLEYSLIFLGILLLFGAVLMLGFIKVSPNVAEGLIFFSFLILFEFILVFAEPYINEYTDGEPIYTLLANAAIALLIFPLHDVLESKLKKRIVKK